jgi:hypothetical protein
MTANTLNLPEKSIDWLQDLIQLNIDSRDGFKEAADELEAVSKPPHDDHEAGELNKAVK